MKTFTLLATATAAVLTLWAHQARTADAKKPLVVLSTSDVIGYTTPCG
jgi:hypothetical protein